MPTQKHLDNHIKTVTEHSLCVLTQLRLISKELENRGLTHDSSKLKLPEVEGWACNARCYTVQYGTDEYYENLERIKESLEHHYLHNRHHPEHFSNGVAGMTLVDVLEMICDWRSMASMSSTDIESVLDYQKERFKISDQLMQIIKNTYDWLTANG